MGTKWKMIASDQRGGQLNVADIELDDSRCVYRMTWKGSKNVPANVAQVIIKQPQSYTELRVLSHDFGGLINPANKAGSSPLEAGIAVNPAQVAKFIKILKTIKEVGFWTIISLLFSSSFRERIKDSVFMVKAFAFPSITKKSLDSNSQTNLETAKLFYDFIPFWDKSEKINKSFVERVLVSIADEDYFSYNAIDSNQLNIIKNRYRDVLISSGFETSHFIRHDEFIRTELRSKMIKMSSQMSEFGSILRAFILYFSIDRMQTKFFKVLSDGGNPIELIINRSSIINDLSLMMILGDVIYSNNLCMNTMAVIPPASGFVEFLKQNSKIERNAGSSKNSRKAFLDLVILWKLALYLEIQDVFSKLFDVKFVID